MAPTYNHLKCKQCSRTESMFWKSIGENQHLCYECTEPGKNKSELDNVRKTDERKTTKTRKSTRSTRYNGKNGNGTVAGTSQTTSNAGKAVNSKPSGRGRRNLNRRPPVKTPTIPASTRQVDSLFYKVCYHMPLIFKHSYDINSTTIIYRLFLFLFRFWHRHCPLS